MAQDATGNVSLFGVYRNARASGRRSIGNYGLFAAMLSADGSKVIYNTDLGQSPDAVAQGVALDSAGNVYAAGTSSSPQFPTVAGSPQLGADFVLRLTAAGVAQKLFSFPRGVVTSPPHIDASDRLLLLGATGAALTLPVAYNFDSPLVVPRLCECRVVSDEQRHVAPGRWCPCSATNLGASQVTLDAVTAPVIYNGATQIKP